MPHAENRPARVADRPAPRRTAPTAAERARTILQFASSVVADVPGIDLVNRPGIPPLVSCAALPDGALAVLVESPSPLHRVVALSREEEVPAELEAVDVAPVAVPQRIRARAHAHGRLTLLPAGGPDRIEQLFPHRGPAGHALLRLELDHLAVEDLWGADCCIDLGAFAVAAPDPIAGDEACLLQHLAAAHPDQLALLGARALARRTARHAWPGPVGALREVAPVALDRFGLRVRLIGDPQGGPEDTGPSGRLLDARFEFEHPVTVPDELPEAMHRLFAGLRH
ncbi:DUF2470 domain-containing protein [Kitasatospora sp. NPDC048540]|uniref:hypothetical protein n=1 Tax=unclassified Kitasatospora TaxID=2633591 RepID=UPI00068F8E1C|nr:hypothetical protein [Kitasatospora sp. MBT63]